MMSALRRLFRKLPTSETADTSPNSSAADPTAQHIHLGNQHKKNGCPDLALASYLSAIRSDPEKADAHAGAGSVLLQLARHQEAQLHLRRAIAINPEHYEAQYNLIYAVLLSGDYVEGLARHENRFWVGPEATRATNQIILNIFKNIPAWKGEPLGDRNLLLWTEQGFGDSLMMLRYIPQIAEKHRCSIDVWCEPELVRLFQTLGPIVRVCSKDEQFLIRPNTVHCSMMSLPFIFNTTLATIPNKVPYLTIPTELVSSWAARLAQHRGMKVGLVWAGNPAKNSDSLRSIAFECLSPLLTVPGINFISLQKGPAAQQAESAKLVDWMPECNDLIDTAALIAGLDLIICVDTSIAHLAGALGKTVWLLNRFESEWRWMVDHEDSPWYPNMRIFRQRALHNWEHPIESVRQALVSIDK